VVFAQGPITSELVGSVNSEDLKSGLEGAKIEIYRNGSKYKTIVVESKGKFNIVLEPGAVYKLEFTYPGHVTKRMEYDSRSLTPDQEYGGYFKFDMNLFQEREGLDVSVLNKPIGKLFYNPEIGDIDFDKAYTQSIKAEIDRLQAELDAKLKAEEEAKKEAEAGYAKAIASGDKAMSSKDYLKAKQEYTRALSYKPDEKYAQNQLEQAKKLYDEAQAERENENAYKEAIEEAEFAMYENDLKKAESSFEKALGFKPGDKYAKDQLKEVQSKMMNAAKSEQEYVTAIQKADAALDAKDFITAKGEYQKAMAAKPSEEYPKGQLELVNSMIAADAEKEKNYIKAIERGDNAMDIKDYESAKAAFAQAAEIKPQEKYPKDQIAVIDQKIAELAKLNADYDAAVKAGDEAFGKNEFDVAKASYTKAGGLKPDEQYPKDQLAAIEKKIADMAKVEAEYQAIIKEADSRYDIKEYVAAKAEYTKALALKPGEAHPTKRLEEVTRLLDEMAEQDAAYKAAIENADNAFNAKDFLSAKVEYESALKIKPNEKYPQDQLNLALEQLKAAEQLEADYEKAIADGDAAMASADYTAAKTAFEKAGTLKPEEKYPKEKLEEIAAKIVELENANKQYQEMIAAGDQAFEAKDYKAAQTSYKDAAGLKPTEQYPQDQLAKITTLLAEAEQLEADYEAAITAADKAFDAKDYNVAKSEYEKALGFKPEEKHPTGRLAEIETLLAEMAEQDAAYTAAIKSADDAFATNDFTTAKTAYEEALGLKPDEQYPKDKIADIDGKLAAAAELEANYIKAIEEGDKAHKNEDYAAAKTAFETAAGLKPEEQYPKDKIAEITALIGAAEALEKDYADALKMGDEALANNELDIAKTAFEKASGLKPNEAYPKDKLAEIEKIKADEAAAIELANKAKEEYDAHIAKGDEAFAANEFEVARSSYQEALKVKPEEAYPKDQLTKIDAKIAELEAEANAAEEAEKKRAAYDASIAKADQLFEAKDYDAAISEYEVAKGILPEETYPADQLAKIAQLRADEAAAIELANKAAEEEYQGFIAAGDEAFNAANYSEAESSYRSALGVKPEATYPQEQIAKIATMKSEAAEQEKQYNDLLASADKAFKAEDYAKAKSDYQAASAVKPSEQYPKDQLTEIDRLVAEAAALADKEKQEAEAKEKEEAYNGFIATADKAFKAESYDEARSAYESALGVKPEEAYPKDQLTEIDRLVAEAKALAEQQQQEAAAAEREKQYNDLIASADKSFKSGAYEEAKGAYTSALEIKPGEAHPTAQLAEIERLVAEAALLAEQEQAAAAAKEKEEAYNGFIATADKSFKGKDYETARTNYNSALEVKPSEQYPKDQLAEIDRLVSEAAALADKERLEAEAKEKEKRFNDFISTGDKAFKGKNYEEAKSAYQSALAIKADAQHPADRLKEIETLLGALAAAEEKESRYNKLIAKADSEFDAGQFEAAKGNYESALQVKPGEEHPQERLIRIEEELAKLAELNQLEAEKKQKLEARYARHLETADQAFAAEQYEQATREYKAALDVKPGEQYPQDQINKISELLAERAEKDEAAAERKAMLAKYDQQILQGDKAFASKNYKSASDAYRAALQIMPDEAYPKKKINEINDILSKAKEPVAVKTTPDKPRAKVTGKSEEDIAAMMAEMVRKREEAKAERIRKLKQDVEDAEGGRVMDASRRRSDAQAELAVLEEEVLSMGEDKSEFYVKRVEEVEVYTEQVEETQANYVEQADERREDTHEELKTLTKDIEEAQKKGNDLHLLSAERVATRKIELDQTHADYVKDADNRRGEAQTEIEELVAYQGEIRDEGEAERMKNAANFAAFQTSLTEQERGRVKAADERRTEAVEENEELAGQINEWNNELQNLHLTKAEQLAKEEEAIRSEEQRRVDQADDRRDNNYEAIEQYRAEVVQVTQEKNNNYNENNQKVQERTEAINTYQEGLIKSADARRDAYDVEYYQGEKQARKSADASKYPQGVTEETYEEGNSIVVKRFVVTGETLDEYEKIYYTWGGVFYKKNGQDITAAIWDAETK
jgi:tetratricopeptide (TPR) repeat protein